ncbi:MAG: DUF3261 domain-containing protein [Porticoccaceae bacterium]
MRALAAFVLAAAIGGCAGPGALPRHAQPPLPAPAGLPCCWQSQEQVHVSAQGADQTLLAAVAVTPGKLTLVAFDGLGRRLVTVVHTGGEPQTLDAPPGWSAELSHQLLLAIYLHNLALDQWRFDDPGWSVVEATARESRIRSLRYGKRELVRLSYATPGDGGDSARDVEYIGRDIRLGILTLSRADL